MLACANSDGFWLSPWAVYLQQPFHVWTQHRHAASGNAMLRHEFGGAADVGLLSSSLQCHRYSSHGDPGSSSHRPRSARSTGGRRRRERHATGHTPGHRSERHGHSYADAEVDELGPRRASDPGAIWANEIADDEVTPPVSPRGSRQGSLTASSKASWRAFMDKVSSSGGRNRPPAHPTPPR